MALNHKLRSIVVSQYKLSTRIQSLFFYQNYCQGSCYQVWQLDFVVNTYT